jgi:hypothetical protein
MLIAPGQATVCLPQCRHADGEPPEGCVGNDTCYSDSFSVDSHNAVVGYGYCYGGCRSDADCKGGDFCETVTGLCNRTTWTMPKPPGAPCSSSSDCWCMFGDGQMEGYCLNACVTASTTRGCSAGATCDPELIANVLDGRIVSRTVSPSIAGLCLLDCTADKDCPSGGFYCWAAPGMAQKTCHRFRDPRVPRDAASE